MTQNTILESGVSAADQGAGQQSLTILRHRTISAKARALGLVMRCAVFPTIWAFGLLARSAPWPCFVVAFFAGLIDQGAKFVLRPFGETRHTEERLANCSARWSQPHGVPQRPERAVLYLHGGAFVACGMNSHKRLANRLGHHAGAGVLLMDYRQLPYHTVDESVRDCVDGYRWLLAQGFSPEKIAFAGDSAGGYLVFATALRARDEGLPLPAALVAMAPWTDWDIRGKTTAPSARQDRYLPVSALPVVGILVGRAQRAAFLEGRARPVPDLFASRLAGLPPSMIHVSDSELVSPDAYKLAAALGEAGVATTLKIWTKQPHVFQGVSESTVEAKASFVELGAFIRSATE